MEQFPGHYFRVSLLLIAFGLGACSLIESEPPPGIGSTKLSEVDGMVMVYVPAGEFLMGSDDSDTEAASDEAPQHTVFLDAYWIDRTEVTNAMYMGCVEAGGCSPLVTPRLDFREHPDFPVQGAAWFQAQAYCQWAGRRLPTEAEWEKAARGVDGRLYPWGNEPPNPDLANFGFGVGDVREVGSYPQGASPYGALDMAGNVWEWVLDWYDDFYYFASPDENPPGPDSGIVRVVRGGAWNTHGPAVRAANRFNAFPGRNDFDGFRCVMD